jgi:hypothetical protein
LLEYFQQIAYQPRVRGQQHPPSCLYYALKL